ncbi:MAG: hypothetical protein V2I79_09700, partial [Xanthomonadales bacterium]|nr:hypothetical protein [Xanthomonadales bacterium]
MNAIRTKTLRDRTARGLSASRSFIGRLLATRPVQEAAGTLTGDEKMVRVGCPAHNCGGRCLLRVYVRDGMIRRIETDDRPGDTVADPQLRACMRGRSYRHRQD